MTMNNELDLVAVRLIKEKTYYSDAPVNSPEAVVDFLKQELSTYDREVMCVVNLSTKCDVINLNFVSMGTINSAVIEMRELFKASILSNAASIVCCHNHPSGDPTPSKEDIKLTERIGLSGKLLGIELLDHIIIGRGNMPYYSMLEEDVLPVGNMEVFKMAIEKEHQKQREKRL
ncbi:DNA repair protein RadC [Lachnospiraceae bacterium PF1-22]